MRPHLLRSLRCTLSLVCFGGCARDPGSDMWASSDVGTTNETSEGESSSAASDGDSSESADSGTLFDVAPPQCGGGESFSYIWIANAAQGTVSKLDTRSVTEVARYQSRPDLLGDPSRTSVDLNGDAAVANRSGGITKFWARSSDCVDEDESGTIETSIGKNDVLAWEDEECRAWHTPFPMINGSQRPVAFTSGEFDRALCRWTNIKLWTATYDLEISPDVAVHLLDGETGAIEQSVTVEGIELSGLGAYGGAVDLEGDFWFFTDVSNSPLVEVELDTLAYTVHIAPVNGYGITVDHAGRVWLAGQDGTTRFDPETTQWVVLPGVFGTGIQEDGGGRMWMGHSPDAGGNPPEGIRWIDSETFELGPLLLQESTENIRGVSIDGDSYVWAVQIGNIAYRLDPDTLEVVAYDGLDGAYTYSDMTGWGLANVSPAG